MRKITHDEILKRQKKKNKVAKLPFSVILNNIRSLQNVGSIFRTADAVGVEKIWLCGITGYPPDKKLSKTALGAEDNVLWEYRKDVLSVIEELKNKKYQTVLLEQIEGSCPYNEFIPKAPVCLILGNEISGVSSKVLDSCDKAIEIEMMGKKNSLNVAVAFGIAAYHIRNIL